MLLLRFIIFSILILVAFAHTPQTASKHAHPLARRMQEHWGVDASSRKGEVYAVENDDPKDFASALSTKHTDSIVACVQYHMGVDGKAALAQYFAHVETIHSDKPTDRTCFLLVRDETHKGSYEQDQELTRVAASIGLTSWHILHPALKVGTSGLSLISNNGKFESIAFAHQQRREQESTSAPKTRPDNYFYLPYLDHDKKKKNAASAFAHEYDIQVSLMPGTLSKASSSSSSDGVHGEENIKAVLQHINMQRPNGEADIEADRQLLRRLSRDSDKSSSSDGDSDSSRSRPSSFWSEGNACLDEASANLKAARTNRRLRESSTTTHYGIDYHKIAVSNPIGFHLPSPNLHGGRRSKVQEDNSNAVLSRSCHILLYAKLAQHPSVLNIELVPRKQIFNDVSKSAVQSNTQVDGTGNRVTSWPYANLGLNGNGQVIIVCDTGLDTDHCQFQENSGVAKVPQALYSNPVTDMTKRKVVQYTYWQHSDTDDVDSGHGTHMASSSCGQYVGSIAGADQYDGMAPEAKLAFWDIGKGDNLATPVDSSILFTPGLQAGAHIFSGSWGSTVNQHDQGSYTIDKYAYKSDSQFLAVFAAGNDGSEGYFSVGNPGMAKNVLTVGAFETNFLGASGLRAPNMGNIAYFSSIGPTFDWRIKPDIVSPGMYIVAAKAAGGPSCAFNSAAGTSSATALTSGLAAIVRQYYMDSNFYQAVSVAASPPRLAFTPSGALVKATLIHSGQNMRRYSPQLITGSTDDDILIPTEIQKNTILDGTYQDSSYKTSGQDHPVVGNGNTPDYISGFGRIFLQNALPIPGVSNYPIDLHAFNDVTLTSNTEYSWFIHTPASGNWLIGAGATDSSALLRATLVWMDPPMFPFVEKNVIHDLDLIITEVASISSDYPEPSANAPIWFGNGGDQPDSTNNVEQISISSTTIDREPIALKMNSFYRVTVRGHLFTEASSQTFSLVITTPKTDAAGANGKSVMTSPDYDNTAPSPVPIGSNTNLDAIENICANDELEITASLSSHLAEGWQGGDQYSITNKVGTASFTYTSSMNSTQTVTQFQMNEVLCLKAGEYEVQLQGNFQIGQTAVDINDCYVHLQGMYDTVATIKVVADTNGILRCNYCDPVADGNGDKHFPIEVQMLGSIYGGRLSYGWENRTSYAINFEGNTLYHNTLNQGILGYHTYCLTEGSYEIGFASISSDDDFGQRAVNGGSWTFGVWGVVEYSMRFMGCGFKPIGGVNAYTYDGSGNVSPNSIAARTIRATDDASYCSQNFGDGWAVDFSDDDGIIVIVDEKNINKIILGAIALALIIIIGIVYFLLRKNDYLTTPESLNDGELNNVEAIEMTATGSGRTSTSNPPLHPISKTHPSQSQNQTHIQSSHTAMNQFKSVAGDVEETEVISI